MMTLLLLCFTRHHTIYVQKSTNFTTKNTLNPLTTLLLIILRTFYSLSTTSELVLVGFASFFDDLTVVKLMFVFVSWRKKLTKREPKHSSESFFAHTTDMWKKIKKKSCKGFFGKIESYKLCFVWGYQFVRKNLPNQRCWVWSKKKDEWDFRDERRSYIYVVFEE